MILKYFSKQYLFQINTINLDRSDKIFFAIGAVFMVIAIVLKLSELYAPTPVDAKYRKNFFALALTMGLSLVLWFALRYEHVTFFGSHFVALLVLLIGLVWFAFLALSFLKRFRTEKTVWEKEQMKMKYLPK